MRHPLLPWVVGVITLPVLAQQSPNFRIEQGTLNAGGHPAGGTVLASPSFELTLDALGQGVAGTPAAGPVFSVVSGLAAVYRPPQEVQNLRFLDGTTITWDQDPAAGDYQMYQGLVTSPFDPAYGICRQPPSPIPGTSAAVTDTPSPGQSLFILITARNRLREEGTKGFASDGTERPNPVPCP